MADSSVQASDQVGTAGVVFASDLVSAKQYPISKLAFGALGTINLVDSISTNPLPVALSATDNAVLDAIAASVAGTLTVGAHAVTNAGTFAVQVDGAALTALQLIDDIVFTDDTSTHTSGTTKGAGIMAVAEPTDVAVQANDIGMVSMTTGRELFVASGATALEVDVTAGTLAAVTTITNTVTVDNAGTFVTQIDGAALTALQLIDNPIFADDAAFTLASSSVSMAGAIRDDSLGTLTAIEGDAVPLRVNSTGALHVTGGGGGTEYTEDVASANPIVGTATLMERDDALTTVTPIEGDWIGFRGTAEGALWVQDFNSDGILADTNTIAGDTTSIDGKITACDTSALLTTTAHDATFGTAGTADAQVRSVQGVASMTPLLVDATGQGDVPITLSGESVTIGTWSAGTLTVDLGANNDVQGDIAHDAVNSGNPFQLGAQAIAHGSNPTAVAAADRTKLYANRAGVPFVIGGHPNVVSKSARNTAAQTDTALVTIAGGLKIVVTRVSLTVDNSCTVDVDFECGFGATAVPTAATGAGVAGMLADFMGVKAGGGITIGDGSGILGVGADGEDLRYSNTVPTTGNCTITVSYYTIES